MTKYLKKFILVLWDSSSPLASQNDNSTFFCHSEESRRKADDEESKNIHSFLRDSSFHFVPFRMTVLFFSCHSEEFAVRRTTKNLKKFILVFWDSSSPSASQNDNSTFFCHSEESSRKADDEESKNIPSFLRDSSFRFAPFRMTLFFFSVILRNSPKANDEES